jgi:hypothetical protein
MKLLRLVVVGLIASLPAAWQAKGKTIMIEFLQGSISPGNVGLLSGLFCRNVDHIVHIKIAVDWPAEQAVAETTDYKRLVFWDSQSEYLFPAESYSFQHGSYLVNGYFIARSGGMHQGIVSIAFDRVEDALVLLNPYVEEVRATTSDCSK